eukprot:10267137-Prorocentrum_lima.AAC.1
MAPSAASTGATSRKPRRTRAHSRSGSHWGVGCGRHAPGSVPGDPKHGLREEGARSPLPRSLPRS